MTLKLQKTFSLALIGVTSVIAIYALGFMTDFYILYMDGNQEMFSFFKDLQSLNNLLFFSTIILLALAIFQIPFEIHKVTVSIWGLFYSFIIEIVSLISVLRLFQSNEAFREIYVNLDFSSLEGYSANLGPFIFIKVSYLLVLAVSTLLLLFTTINFFKEGHKLGVKYEA